MKSVALVAGILILAGLAGLFVYKMGKPASSPVSTEQKMVTITPAPTAVDSSNAGLDKSTADEDTKLNALDSDAKNIDQGLNDVQGDLSE